jgi:hypothetical protein
MTDRSRRIVLAAVPAGFPRETEIKVEEMAVPSCAPNGLTVRALWINAPRAFIGLFQGENTGKALVKL